MAKFAIILSGGVVQSVVSDVEEGHDVFLIDYDIDGLTEEEKEEGCFDVPQEPLNSVDQEVEMNKAEGGHFTYGKEGETQEQVENFFKRLEKEVDKMEKRRGR